MEFCLVATPRASRWEFPHTEIKKEESPLEAACRSVHEEAGFKCRPAKLEPLDDTEATHNRQLVRLTSFLLEVQDADKTDAPRPIRWCLAEEARARIRRKPMRRLIDLALRHKQAE
jgi:8-oxo-dGTP pyrophosphatase MutT (NUDIX family)